MKKEIRQVIVDGDIAYVPLTRGLFAIIDASMADNVAKYNWQAIKAPNTNYVSRVSVSKGIRTTISLHRFVMGFPDCKQVDHINGNGLDNRLSNLREASPSQNACNRKRHIKNTSGYKGVSFKKSINRWQCDIKINGKRYYLGVYKTPEEAHSVREKALLDYHGDYGCSYAKT